MDIDLNEEQDMLRKMSRDFLTTKCPGSLVRAMMKDERGYPPDIWKEISELGWLGLAFPSQYGGEGGSFLDLMVLIEEMGRVCFPGPFLSSVIGGLFILHAGNEEQKKEFLPRLCKGKLLATLAVYEEDIRFDSSGINLKATHDKDGFVLSGAKMFVPDANVADLLICVARTGKAQGTDDGITLFLVDSKSPGVECTLLKPLDGSKQCRVVFNKVKVPGSAVLGTVDKGWQAARKILDMAAAAKCAEMLGGAEAVVAMTVQYSKERIQFGHPIGSYQSQQHRCADMKTDVDGMRLTTYQAGWMLSENIPCVREVAIAKAWASDSFRRIVYAGLRLHGGMAVINEHDMTLHYKKALASEFYFGDARYHRKVVLQELGV